MLTRREIFNKVKTHLLAQGVQALNTTGNCCYRTGGLKCAAGCLILDEFYSPDLEGRKVVHLAVAEALKASGVQEYDLVFLQRLQRLHDSRAPKAWAHELDKIEQGGLD